MVLEDIPHVLLALREHRESALNLYEASRAFEFHPLDSMVVCIYRVWGYTHYVQEFIVPRDSVVQVVDHLFNWVLSSAASKGYITIEEAGTNFNEP